MKLLLDVPDKQADFAMKVLHSLSFVKKVKHLSASAAKLFDELKEAADEVRLHKQGKIKLKTAKDLLNEL